MTPCWRPIISSIALSITSGQWAVTGPSGNPSPKFGADVPLSAILAPNFGLAHEGRLKFGVVVPLSAMLAPNFGDGVNVSGEVEGGGGAVGFGSGGVGEVGAGTRVEDRS